MQKIRLLLVEDQTVLREGLKQLIETEDGLQVVAEAGSLAEAVQMARRFRPDVVLLDLKLPDGSGLEATRQMLSGENPPAVLILSTYTDSALVKSALELGAAGYIPKTASFTEIAAAVRTAAEGGVVLHPSLAGKIVPRRGEVEVNNQELSVLNLLAEGASYGEIGARLFLSERTVRRRMNLLFAKMGVQSSAQAVAEAMRRGLLR